VLDHASHLNPANADVKHLLFNDCLILASKSRALKQMVEARNYLLRAAGLYPEDPEPHRRLAELYQSNGDAKDAEGERKRAAELGSH
jgi:predicted Zn-dependent protease